MQGREVKGLFEGETHLVCYTGTRRKVVTNFFCSLLQCGSLSVLNGRDLIDRLLRPNSTSLLSVSAPKNDVLGFAWSSVIAAASHEL